MNDQNTNILSAIRINQNGYATGLPVYITVLSGSPVELYDLSGELIKRIEDINLSLDEASEDNVCTVDLGPLPVGTYKITCGDMDREITVNEKPFNVLTDSLIKALYYQRCGCELYEKHAGPYTHKACHTAPASEWENTSVKKTITGGWHDAGDYGKYVGPGAVTAAHMLYAYKLFPDGCSNNLNIPESGNDVPDILNEVRYELDWILKMQREDGAFYHKLTKARFAPFIMPEDDLEPEYLMPVSHCATAAAVAVLALSSRIWRKYDDTFADNAFSAAMKGFVWLQNNQEFIPFKNPEGVNTGMYGDWSVKDELFWACCELYATTFDKEFLHEAENIYTYAKNPESEYKGHFFKEMLKKEIEIFEDFKKRFNHPDFMNRFTPGLNLTQFGWADVSGLGALCCLFELKEKSGKILYEELKEDFLARSEEALKRVNESGYRTALKTGEYVWGGILNLMANAMSMIMNHLLTGRKDMQAGALCQLDYSLGLNALDMSFITGFGEKSVMNPHHRPSGSDNIETPVPGFIVGGPNKAWTYPETKERLKETPAAKYYLDELPSADTNEIAIYWNSPVIFVAAYFNSL